MLPIHQEFTSSLQYAYDMGYITNMLQNKEKQSNQSQGQNDQIQAFVDAQKQELLDFAIKYNDVIMSSSELNEVFSSEISIEDFKDKVENIAKNTSNEQINTADIQSQNTAKQDRSDEIERNNRMLMRKYNGAKSRSASFESKNEILKTFFEEFLKNNNPLAFLEIMKKTDIKA
ncbi:MAG: hypothetical protein ACI35K_06420 [Campylobacter sp.]